MNNQEENHSTAVTDAKQLGLFAALASLSYVFWVLGGMEMVERLAFYGVKATATLYAKDPVSAGGLGITLSKFGIILSVWALVQSFVPVLTGGLADRLGYKETIFLSTVIKILGYLLMAFFPTFWGFFFGAVVLAFGTGIFKPGIQGTLVKATNRRNSSMAWGVFYQTVNIGGFLGPLVAAQLRQLEWKYVFFACAAIISINFILLLLYKEPGREDRLAFRQKVLAGEIRQDALWLDSLKEFAKPELWRYLLVFSGFWFMFNAFFDVLPAHIDDWVDTSVIVNDLFGEGGTRNSVAIFFLGMDQSGTFIKPEGLLNLNAGLIMLICFLVAAYSATLKAINSMIVGTLLSTAALILIGGVQWAWMMVIAILLFSMGEMLSSPKFSEYLGNIAPTQKKAMYLGFSQFALGIGWTLEGFLGPYWYDTWASKERFSRELLADRGMDAGGIDAIPQGESFTYLVEFTGESPAKLTELLYQTHNIGMVWYVMAVVGFASAYGLYLYGRWAYQLARQDNGVNVTQDVASNS
ncbi:MAG: MFS transporter [Pseudomonadales bacterium]|nr:MFS transporter [Pseudomonadales bacterium]MDP7594847.1 MFS transporter [Pseudomonadales bacterium]HJN51779.1 MFS transporter [Pseudomonadales bacterium]